VCPGSYAWCQQPQLDQFIVQGYRVWRQRSLSYRVGRREGRSPSSEGSLLTSSEINMKSYDDDLRNFEAHGAAPLPAANDKSHVDHDGARIWYATYGAGSPVILLHGGLGHSGNWGYQVPMLVGSGYRTVLIDSRAATAAVHAICGPLRMS
jgi:hypothetical protein